MKSILSVTDLDSADFVIKWRMTDMCNANCSYCIRKGHREKIDRGLIKKQEERLSEVADEISRMLSGASFSNVKIDLIGGEVSVLNLEKILGNLHFEKVKRINITTNLLRDCGYYESLCGFLHDMGTKISATASFHSEAQTFDDYFKKIEKLKNAFDSLTLEIVSTENNQNLCRKFIRKCRKIKADYMVEADLRFKKNGVCNSPIITDCSKKQKKARYKVVFTDGTERFYKSRNQLLIDTDNAENRCQKALHTNGFFCTHSFSYVCIDFDTAIGRTEKSGKCSNRMSVEKFKIIRPAKCEEQNCTLCGHMSIWREK